MADSNDTYFQAPACLDLGSSCSTNDEEIAGVGSFEPNNSNTVDHCTDNSLAVWGQDEYINRIIVRAVDGGTMTAGEMLQIHVSVSTAKDTSGRSKPDALETMHIYFASDSYGERLPCYL